LLTEKLKLRLSAPDPCDEDTDSLGKATEHETKEPPPLAVVRAALECIPSDDRNEKWVKYGQALKHDYGPDGYTVWIEWSRKSGKWKAGDEEKWETFDKNKRVRPVRTWTILKEARREYGFVYAPEFDGIDTNSEKRTTGEMAIPTPIVESSAELHDRDFP